MPSLPDKPEGPAANRGLLDALCKQMIAAVIQSLVNDPTRSDGLCEGPQCREESTPRALDPLRLSRIDPPMERRDKEEPTLSQTARQG